MDPWVLSWTDPQTGTPASLSNGLLGLRIGRTGTGLDASGAPLPCFFHEEYETSGEEKIRTLPNPLAVSATIDGRPLNLSAATGYRQRIDLRTGVLVTEWKSGDNVRVRVETAIHPSRPAAGIRIVIEADRPTRVGFRSAVEGGVGAIAESGGRPESSVVKLWGSGRPIFAAHRLKAPTGEWQEQGVVWTWTATSVAREVTFEKLVSFEASSPIDVESLFEETRAIWSRRWQTDIEIDGPAEDQLAVRSFIFYLRSSVHPQARMSVAPFGLTDNTYAGHVFWDADTWVLPAVAWFDPDAAASISGYRLRLLPSATANFRLQNDGDMPAEPVYQFPWQSSVSGLEVAPGDSKHEVHVSGDVVHSLQIGADLGIVSQAEVDRVGLGVARYYIFRSAGPLKDRTLLGVMSPDEFHIGDNDLYTNMLAEWVIRRYGPAEWRAVTFRKPSDGQGLLTYDHDRLRGYKQAAAVLAIFPLQNAAAEQQARTMMARFAGKVTPNGPAMSDSVHATIFARIGMVDEAYDAWRTGWMDFTDHPLMLFTEKRAKDVGYFTTGAAGCLQTVVFGFLGFRIDSQRDSGAGWSLPLGEGAYLHIESHLPKAWKSVRFKNFAVRGRRYNLVATHDSIQVTQGVP